MTSGVWQRLLPWPVAAAAMFLGGCSPGSWPLLEPAGPVALSERNLTLAVIGVMLVVVVPVIVMTGWFAWRYRASNHAAVYAPDWSDNRVLSVLFWVVPGIMIAVLGAIAWVASHSLSPYKPLAPNATPLTVQVVALDWKWLFIYPKQHIASVNRVVLPVGVPVKFRITSDTVLNAFFIPRLGGQVYAMAGRSTQLHLKATRAGTYYGENTQYSGRGFPFQNFEAKVVSASGFDDWVNKVRHEHRPLDESTYARLSRPSVRNPVVTYSSVTPHLFADTIKKYTHTGSGTPASTGQNARN